LAWLIWLILVAVLLFDGAMHGDVGMVLPLLLVATLGFFAWYRWDRPHELRRERRAKGLCVRCGYDLRGNVSGVCPECGEVAP
jgi:hypothetical protein